MDVHSMQFISHRDSIASNFASQTQNSSSMLSSRKRLLDDQQENDLQDFKQEIQFKFIRSVANKIYTYPLNEEGFDKFDDQQQFSDLMGLTEYNLFDQKPIQPDRFKKQQFKIKNQKINNKTASLLLQTLKSQRERISNLRDYINQSIQSKKQSRNAGIFYEDLAGHSNRDYQQQHRKKRLNTQPYQKPMGFIIKKK